MSIRTPTHINTTRRRLRRADCARRRFDDDRRDAAQVVVASPTNNGRLSSEVNHEPAKRPRNQRSLVTRPLQEPASPSPFDTSVFRSYLLDLLPPLLGATPDELHDTLFDSEFNERVSSSQAKLAQSSTFSSAKRSQPCVSCRIGTPI